MILLWCDTETTGLDPSVAAPFQVAFIFVRNEKNGERYEEKKAFYLNPLVIPGIEYNEDAGKVHGYSRKTIETFEPAEKVVADMDEWLGSGRTEKMYFCGYNAKFDFQHLSELFKKCGFNFEQYFNKQILDVFEQVKQAGKMRILPYLPNRKLTTIAEFLKIDLSNAHDAMGDITATREVAKSLANLGVSLR